MKKYLIYAGLFLGSFLVINVGMYFLLDMTQPKTAVESQSATDSTHSPMDSLHAGPLEMVQKQHTDSTDEQSMESVPENDSSEELAAATHENTIPETAEEATQQDELPEDTITQQATAASAENVQAVHTSDPKELAKLAKVLEGMKSDEAAAIASRLEIEEIVSLVMKMKDRKAAKMMAALPVDQAARVAARMSEIVEQGKIQS